MYIVIHKLSQIYINYPFSFIHYYLLFYMKPDTISIIIYDITDILFQTHSLKVKTETFRLHLFSGPLGSTTPIFSVLKVGARGRERCCTFHYLSRTDSIKPNLQFSFVNFGLLALEGSTFTRIFLFIKNNT